MVSDIKQQHIIRLAKESDHESIWAILKPVIQAGETYALPNNMNQEEALAYWFSAGNEVFVAEDDREIIGTYFLHANNRGGGAHVANCGYITASQATGRGIARSMCAHSVDYAKARGFRAMQFNFVVSSNERAVKLWQSLGFKIVGTLPGPFCHPRLGFIDVYIMYRSL